MLGRGQRKREQSTPSGDRRALEKEIANLHRLLGQQQFNSPEEAQAFLQQLLSQSRGRVPEQAPRSAVDEAQDVMYEAWDARGRRRVELARKALEISPDCADAYVLLAEETAATVSEARDLYERGVAAGERALGEGMFRKEAGHFWEMLETRPYMRARAGLAACLWELGEREEALDHWVDMLRLNPTDSLGVRYRLVAGLLAVGRDEVAGKLLQVYQGDPTAPWLYSRALCSFRREGNSRRSRRRLREALEGNPYVPEYLLGKRRLPRRLLEAVGIGDRDEAVSCAAEAMAVWSETAGALEWLAETWREL